MGYIEGERKIEQAISILHVAEKRHGLRIIAMDEINHEEAGPNDAWTEAVLYPFFNTTHFVVTGGDLSRLLKYLIIRTVPFLSPGGNGAKLSPNGPTAIGSSDHLD